MGGKGHGREVCSLTGLPPPVGAVARVASRHYGADPNDGVGPFRWSGEESQAGNGIARSCVCQRTDTTADDAQHTAIVPKDMDRSS